MLGYLALLTCLTCGILRYTSAPSLLRWLLPAIATQDGVQTHARGAAQALGEAGDGNPEPRQEPTGLPLATLQWVGRSMCSVPDGFSLHPDVDKLLAARRSGF